jgi:hypothetical protein
MQKVEHNGWDNFHCANTKLPLPDSACKAWPGFARPQTLSKKFCCRNKTANYLNFCLQKIVSIGVWNYATLSCPVLL